MKILLTALFLCAAVRAAEFEVLMINGAHWPRGQVFTWRLYGKWPSVRAKELRAALKSIPDFKEDQSSGIVSFEWCPEKPVYDLYPGSTALIQLTAYAPEHQATLIGAYVNFDAKSFRAFNRSLITQKFQDVATIIRNVGE